MQVHLCSRQWPDTPLNVSPILDTPNLFARPAPQHIHADGGITFEDGSRAEHVDVIVYATGYRYSYPFLDASSGVTSTDNRWAALI